MDKLLAADESVPNARPLCLTDSDGGELQRGGCCVSVQHRSLHTIFRSAHPHTGKYPPWVPLLPTLSAPCPPSVCLNLWFVSLFNSIIKQSVLLGHAAVSPLWKEQSDGNQILGGIRYWGESHESAGPKLDGHSRFDVIAECFQRT